MFKSSNEKFIKQLLEVLEESCIENKIKDISRSVLNLDNNLEENPINVFENKENENIINDLNETKTESEKYKSEILENKKQLTLLREQQNKLKQTISEYEKEIKIKNDLIKEYEESFKNDFKINEIYASLDDDIKDSLKNIFKNTTIQGLIACGVQERNIGPLWDFIKFKLTEDNKDYKNLVEMFYCLFAKYKLAYPMYELLSTKDGDDFNVEYHIKNGIEQGDKITKILLLGWQNTKNNKVIKQSIVRL